MTAMRSGNLMKKHKGETVVTRTFSRIGVLTILLSGFLLISSVPPASAYANCEQKIRKAERNLEKAISRHGLHSIQAERRREQLERVRERCHRRY